MYNVRNSEREFKCTMMGGGVCGRSRGCAGCCSKGIQGVGGAFVGGAGGVLGAAVKESKV